MYDKLYSTSNEFVNCLKSWFYCDAGYLKNEKTCQPCRIQTIHLCGYKEEHEHADFR